MGELLRRNLIGMGQLPDVLSDFFLRDFDVFFLRDLLHQESSRHRFRLLAKAPRGFDLSGYLRDWLAAAPKAQAGQRVDIDVDPQSFL